MSIETDAKKQQFPCKVVAVKLLLLSDAELVYGDHFLVLAESAKLLYFLNQLLQQLVK